MTINRQTRDLNAAISELIDPNQFRLDLGEPKKRITYNPDSREKGVPSKRANSTKRVPLQLRTLEGALLVIRNLGYSYVVEKTGDDAEVYRHGTLSVFSTNRKDNKQAKKKSHQYARGYLKEFVEPQMCNMKVGELVEISNQHPDGTAISLYSLQSAAGNAAGKFWGNGSVTTSMNPKTKTVEVLRLV
jgi:hypothetical protein